MKVYFDNAATTAIAKPVLAKMMPYLTDNFANPSSIHNPGRAANVVLEEQRALVAQLLGVDRAGIYFTGSATEANNLILTGVAQAYQSKEKKRIIISQIEHPSVSEVAKRLAKQGIKVDYLAVDGNGVASYKDLEQMMGEDVLLVSVMAVNNELGSIAPLKKMATLAHKYKAFFHSDAVQSIPYFNALSLGVDFASYSAHKFAGPKGVGLAYINPEIRIPGLIIGGGQEKNLRAGTYNLANIVGLAQALKLSLAKKDQQIKKLEELREYFISAIKTNFPEVKQNGSKASSVPGIVNLMFPYIEGEAILMDLSAQGISVSTGSACSATDLQASPVLKAIGLKDHYLNSSVRFSFSANNTKAEIDYTIKALIKTVKRLRSFSPFA